MRLATATASKNPHAAGSWLVFVEVQAKEGNLKVCNCVNDGFQDRKRISAAR